MLLLRETNITFRTH